MDAYAILPYKGLVEIASETGRELKLDLKIFEGETEEAIPFAMDAQKRGADCIISRGGTASIIERYVNVPIVRVPVSELDLLRILYPLKGLDRKILVVGFRNAVFRARSAARVLGLQIQELPIPYEAADYNFDHIRRSAEHLIRHYGIDTIIGDQTAFINLRSYCESQYLITSSKDDFLTALRNTQLLNTDIQRDQQDQIQVVLNAVQDGIISTDTHGRVTSFNIKAAEIFGMKPGMVIGASLDELAGYFRDFEELKSTISLTLRNGNPESIQFSRPKGPEVYEINSAPLVSEKGIHGTVTTIIRSSHGHTGKSAGNKHPSAGTFNTHYSFEDILGRDEAFLRVLAVARAYSMTDATILLEGESGVGKEMFAQSIHASGPRKEGPFVAVNCASIPEPLLESELFGYEQGAFTGASRAGQKGLFELAHGGTLFLDEISEIDQKMQMNLLRVLEERQIRRIGSDRLRDIDVRVIAASNRDLRKMIDENHFRPDLFYRLNLLNLHIPALRERKADIPLLAEHFFTQFCRHYGGKEVQFTEDILNRLRNYPWPGNIRELKNIMERTALTIATRCLELSDLEIITRELNNSLSSQNSRKNELSFCGTLNTIKRQAAESALQAAGYNKSQAARMLGIDRSTLDRLLDPRD
ncbi:sigma 54-interacting transcriptional regulator [Marispirochaeta aestuarii]|uniref:sigma 54-interacting transcriptional regulator n=1 Tax=Marispirochaeta aestuarii TaxID=1963862 RepID=UPI0029C63892|nr:sigma 54-interacting transcriptional regulator [Marispirochaeta aestuarii]